MQNVDAETGEITNGRAIVRMPDAKELAQYQSDEALIAVTERILEFGKQELATLPSIASVLESRAKVKGLEEYVLNTGRDRLMKTKMKNNLTELVLREQRWIGTTLTAMPRHQAGYPKQTSQLGTSLPTLDDMSITRKQSSRWQFQAKLPDELFETAMLDAKENDWELSNYDIEKRTVLYLRAMKHGKEAEFPTGKYRVIYADPPWSYGNSMPNITFGEQADHYAPMSIEDICALDVAGVAEDDAVLFLWVTSPILEESFEVVKAWGFTYKSSFVWDKVHHVMGHYNSVRHELLLVCTRGSCQPDIQRLFDSVVTQERTEKHSEKPEIFRQMIDTIYPYGARIELFARERADGWEVFGNELP